MDTSDLRGKLTSLHEQLTHSPAVDGESRQLLSTLLQDIEHVLEQSPAGMARAEPEHHHRLQELLARFDADHPALAAGLRQFVDALGKLGV